MRISKFILVLSLTGLFSVACSKHNDPPTAPTKTSGNGGGGKGGGGSGGSAPAASNNPAQLKMTSRAIILKKVQVGREQKTVQLSHEGKNFLLTNLDVIVEILPHQIPLNVSLLPLEYCSQYPVQSWSTSLYTVCKNITEGMEESRIFGVEATVKDAVKIVTVLRLDDRQIKRQFIADLDVRLCSDKKLDAEKLKQTFQYNPQRALLDFSRQYTKSVSYNSVSNGHYSGARTYDTRCGARLSNIRTASGAVVEIPADISALEPRHSRKLGLEIGSVDALMEEKLSKLVATIDQIPINADLSYAPLVRNRSVLELLPTTAKVDETDSAQLKLTPVGANEPWYFGSPGSGKDADFQFTNNLTWLRY